MGLTEAQLHDVNRWRESDVYSPLERLVLEFAETVSRTPAEHRPDLVARLREHLTEKQLVELTHVVAWENFRARFNRAFDVQPQGYSEGSFCVLPDRGME